MGTTYHMMVNNVVKHEHAAIPSLIYEYVIIRNTNIIYKTTKYKIDPFCDGDVQI